MRINQYLAKRGAATRLGADDLIKRGLVTVNGRPAVLGEQVTESDLVVVKKTGAEKKYHYFAYHKPRGLATEGVAIKNVFPVGRLDKESSGLLILTSDGRITDRLLNPEFAHEKEYLVAVREPLANNWQRRMEAGVLIEGYRTKPCQVEIIDDHSFRIILTEGKKHQIRRMCAALGNAVTALARLRIMNITLGDLAAGTHRPLTDSERQTFLNKLGL